VVIPGARWRPVNFALTTCMFIYISHLVSQATSEIVQRATEVIPTGSSSLNLPSSHIPEESLAEAQIPLMNATVKDRSDDVQAEPEPDTVALPLDWVHYASLRMAWNSWRLGLETKFVLVLMVMWVCNLLWTSE